MSNDSLNTVPPGDPATSAPEPGWWFVFNGDRLLVKTDGRVSTVPFARDPAEFSVSPLWKRWVGNIGGHRCYSALVDGDAAPPPRGFDFHGLRGLFGCLEDIFFSQAGRAMQLIRWDHAHQFCSRCGSRADSRTEDGAQICPGCGYLSYPRISPAVIVAVLKGNRILLAHNNRFPKNRYSVIAGYVEPGETLEACVQREIREEVGIQVKNIRYFGSQPWPFTSSLMVAFTAEHAQGDIAVDDSEISDAAWFPADSLPDIPDKVSIARRLIDWFVQKEKNTI